MIDTLEHAGCKYCAPPTNKLSPEVVHACSSEFLEAYTYSKCNMDLSYRALMPDAARNVSYVNSECSYKGTDLSRIKIPLGE